MKNSLDLSKPKDKVVHGITVQKFTMGKYLEVMRDIDDLPRQLLDTCFPGESIDSVIKKLKVADRNTILTLLTRVGMGAADMLMDLMVKALEVDKDVLLEMSPNELLDVAIAWWEQNDLTAFFKRVWAKVEPKLQATINTGSNNG